MSINFSTLQGLSIPEGVVTEIKDASGRVLWALEKPIPAVLQVAKITSDTYAGSTTYTGENFILLDIYPKTSSSTVTITYGGLTKTLTFSGTNARQVFFGTFNGVSDSVTTSNNGTLTIDGGYSAFGAGSYSSDSKTTKYCSCITNVSEWGQIKNIPNYAFYNCSSLALTSLPQGITSIGNYAFYNCSSLALTSLPQGITSIGNYAFQYCEKIDISEIPYGVRTIGESAFEMYYVQDEIHSDQYYPDTLMYGNRMTLPETIESIGDYAFVWVCSGPGEYLNTVIILATTPPTLGDACFGKIGYGVSDIVVPKGCADVYKAANTWSEYTSFITEVS